MQSASQSPLVVACPECDTKNRVDCSKLDKHRPICGRCKANLEPTVQQMMGGGTIPGVAPVPGVTPGGAGPIPGMDVHPTAGPANTDTPPPHTGTPMEPFGFQPGVPPEAQ